MASSNGIRLFLVLGVVTAASLRAETAFTNRSVNLRAGPGRDYPLVSRIGPGAPVDVAGCTDDWEWCDVGFQGDRGWVWAGNLETPYQGSRVVIYGHGPIVGLPIVPFAVGPYWDTYYRTRPWYSRRSYWAARPLPSHRTVVVRPDTPRSPVSHGPVSHGPVVRAPSRPSTSHAPHQEAPPSRAQPERRAAPQHQERPQRQEKKKGPG